MLCNNISSPRKLNKGYKMKQFSNYSELSKAAHTLNSLTRIGLVFGLAGYPELKDGNNNYAFLAMVNDLRNSCPFFIGESAKDICTLALAIHQEQQNDYIEQEKIDLVNHVFGFAFNFTITYEEVQNFNSKYI
jgi:hypothetical protein